MTEKVYMLVEDDEELPSSQYKNIKAVEMPVLTRDEKNRIEELIKKTDAFLKSYTEKNIDENLNGIVKSLKQLESSITDIRCPDIQEFINISNEHTRILGDMFESSYSLFEKIERKTDIIIKDFRNFTNISNENRDEFILAIKTLNNSMKEIDKKYEDFNFLINGIKILSKNLIEKLSLFDEKEKSMENIISFISKNSEKTTTMISKSDEKIEKINFDIDQVANSIKDYSSKNETKLNELLQSLDDTKKTIENIINSNNETNEKLNSFEIIINKLLCFFEKLTENYMESTKLMKISIDSLESSLKNLKEIQTADMQKRTEEVNSLYNFLEKIDKNNSSTFYENSEKINNITSVLENLKENQNNLNNKVNSIETNQIEKQKEIKEDLKSLKEIQLSNEVKTAKTNENNLSLLQSLTKKLETNEQRIANDISSITSLIKDSDQKQKEKIIHIMEEISSDKKKNMENINLIINSIEELKENQKVATRINFEMLEKLKEEHATKIEKIHNKIENISSDMDLVKQIQTSLNQGFSYNLNSIKDAIEDFSKSHLDSTEKIITQIKTKQKPRKIKKRKSKTPLRKGLKNDNIKRIDKDILNALIGRKLRSVDLSRVVKGNSKLFRARLKNLVNTGKILKIREKRFVYYMLS